MVISGPPGIGKSALVRQYLRQLASDITALWINSENEITIVDSFWRHFTERNNKNDASGRKIKLEKIRDIIDVVCNGRCGFLIFDGCDSVDAVRSYFPGKFSQMKILITTRNKEEESVFRLKAFTEADAEEFVHFYLGNSSAEHLDGIKNLVKAFQGNGNPYGLALATSFIVSGEERPLAENISEYLNQHIKIANLYSKEVITTTVAIMEISFQNLIDQQNSAIRILEIFAYCSSENIPIQLFLPVAGCSDKLYLAIDLLCQYNLITAISKDMIKISRQLQKFIRLKHSENKKKNILRVALKLLGSCPKGQLYNLFYVQLVTVWSFALHHSELVQEFHRIPDAVIRVLMHANRWLEAERFGRQAVIDLTAALSEKHPSTVRMISDCAEIAFHQDKSEEAMVRSLQLGSDHKETVRVWGRLFECLAMRSEWNELVTLCRDELNRSIRVNGTDHQYTMDLRSKISWILRDKEIYLEIMEDISELQVQARYDEAIERCENFINVFCQEMHFKDKAVAMQCLAKLYYLKGDYDRAQQANEALIKDILTVLGADHKDILKPKRYIAMILQANNDLVAASSKYIEVLEDCQRIVGPDHPENFLIRRGQASLLRVAGKLEDSLLAYQDTLDCGELALGHDHPENLITKRCVAALYQELGQYETALSIYKEILTKSINVVGVNHADHLITTRGMAVAFHQIGEHEKAWKLFEKVLRKGEKLLGAEHPDNAITRRAMSEVTLVNSDTCETSASPSKTASEISESESTASNPKSLPEPIQTISSVPAPDFGDALKAYHNVLQHDKTASTTDSSTDLITKCCIAAVMQEQGEYEAALKVYQEVFDRRVAVLGYDHPDNLITRRAMAAVLQKQGKYDEAIRTYREILERGVKVLGADHADNSETKRNIVAVQRQQTKFKNFLTAFHAERRRASKFNTGFVATLLLLVLAVLLYAKEVYV